MATAEYLARYIESGRRYDELPARLKLTTSEEDWRRKVRGFCMERGQPWASSLAATVCSEHEYYDDLLKFFRAQKRLFPYHLADYICRVGRVTAHRYYLNILSDSMKQDKPYDSIPNFTAADIVQVVGIGRNEYIATVVQAKSKRSLWRVNKSAVKDLLPQEPRFLNPQPWWRVHVVNVGEAEYRQLGPDELSLCQAAAHAEGVPVGDVNSHILMKLYKKGLAYIEVPIASGDHLSIPPLEGFVSNKSQSEASDADPLERLLYQIFVAASDNVTVGRLASILSVDVEILKISISMACRLGFCRRWESRMSSVEEALSSEKQRLDLEDLLEIDVGSPNAEKESLPAWSESGGTSIALVVDSEITGFLMMGALTPNCKKHSVTLFEGGRVYGKAVMDELIRELYASVEMAQGFEGEMKALANYAKSLAIALECVKEGSKGSLLELLRKESLASLKPAAAERILAASYCAVIPVAGLAFPPLPVRSGKGPVAWGPGSTAATTPWLHMLLYTRLHLAPPSMILMAGQQLERLPQEMSACHSALIWPWQCEAVKEKTCVPLRVESSGLLPHINDCLMRTAILIQPLPEKCLEVDVPLPLSHGDRVHGYTITGEAVLVDLQVNVTTALESLGLSLALGSLRVIQIGNNWLPLQIILGMPFQPPELCQAACNNATAAHFLESSNRQKHQENQKALAQALHSLIEQHSACRLITAGDGEFDFQVHLPYENIKIHGDGSLEILNTQFYSCHSLSLNRGAHPHKI